MIDAFVRGAQGYLQNEIINYDKIVDNKVEIEYIELSACEIFGNQEYFRWNKFIDNGDGTGIIEYYPVNIEITRIQGTLQKN